MMEHDTILCISDSLYIRPSEQYPFGISRTQGNKL
jgi:hypothetical protein